MQSESYADAMRGLCVSMLSAEIKFTMLTPGHAIFYLATRVTMIRHIHD